MDYSPIVKAPLSGNRSQTLANRNGIEEARSLLERSVRDRVFPAAVAEAGESRGILWREAFGRLTFDEAAPAADEETVFDLASLTKPLATASVVMRLAADGALDLRDRVAAFFAEWRGEDREAVTVQDLLEHAAGLSARLVDPPPRGRREFEHDICAMALEYAPRRRTIYSDLGFILLGFLAADRGSRPLALQFEDIAEDQIAEHQEDLSFGVPEAARARTAPTSPLDDDDRRGRLLVGEVHDAYAAALGGVAGHAGLFGTVRGVGAFARRVLRGARGDGEIRAPLSPPLVARLTRRSSVPGSSRALGWDTMLPTSSCGAGMSQAAFGHVGFTGTSLWIDPVRDRYFVLLTNRVCGGGTIDQMRDVRRAFHDALALV
jgi:CubicO group peptidase (beta-lactamase class C family)